jgi:hypothetical protein
MVVRMTGNETNLHPPGVDPVPKLMDPVTSSLLRRARSRCAPVVQRKQGGRQGAKFGPLWPGSGDPSLGSGCMSTRCAAGEQARRRTVSALAEMGRRQWRAG